MGTVYFNQHMGSCFTAIVVVSFVFVLGCIFSPNEAGALVVFVPIGAVIFTTAVVTIVFLPLRAILYRCFPFLAQRTNAAVAAGFLVLIVTALSQTGTPSDFLGSRLGFWAMWTVYVLALTVCLFWPLSKRSKAEMDKNFEI
jgi:hypothetical protein